MKGTLTSVIAVKWVMFSVPEGQSPEQGSVQINASSRDVLLLLAEICFINAEVCALHR